MKTKQNKWALLLALSISLFIAKIDYLLPQVSLSMYLFIPVCLATWFGNVFWGMGFCLLNTLVFNPFLEVFSYSNLLSQGVFLGLFVFLTEQLQRNLQKESHLARVDPLTGIANTRFFEEYALNKVLQAKENKSPLTTVYMDLDNFKWINDHLGHSTGNVLLKSVASIIEKNLRQEDLVARLGGDEFVILLPNLSHPKVQKIMQRIQNKLLDFMKGQNWPVTFSIGVATFNHPPFSIETMIKRADELMYQAKNSGKNSIQYRPVA